ncbi:hypothetical protein Ancab_040025 [Ancistrocladus abbreviatus]
MWLAFVLFGCLLLVICGSVCSLFYLKRHDGYLLLSPTSHPASPCLEISDQVENEAAVSTQKNDGDCQGLIKRKGRKFVRRKRREDRPALPEDILMEILLRLPGKSLMKCKCVCKSWHCLISDSGFILKHLSQYTCNPEVLGPLLFVGFAHKQRFSFISLDDGSKRTGRDDSVFSIDLASVIDPGNFCPELSLRYLHHCHGIICLCNYEKSAVVALWNPTTREFRILPQSPLALSSSHGPVMWSGFGYDPMTNDFKVVQSRTNNSFLSVESEPPVELYALSTNSWKLLDVDAELVSLLLGNCSCTVRGCLWWTREKLDGHGWSFLVLKFDLNSEAFHKVIPPEHLRGARDDIPGASISALEGNVALILFEWRNRKECFFDIWIMEESGVDVSWNKILSIGPNRGPEIAPIGFRGNNRFLLKRKDDGLVLEVVIYELSTRKIKLVKLNVSEFDRYYNNIYVYKDSLLRIGN